jgi:hypothetical protein
VSPVGESKLPARKLIKKPLMHLHQGFFVSDREDYCVILFRVLNKEKALQQNKN